MIAWCACLPNDSMVCKSSYGTLVRNSKWYTAPQHLVCRVVPSLHINHMQMSIIEVFICRRLHMNTSMIPICIWLICRLCTALHIKCCGAVIMVQEFSVLNIELSLIEMKWNGAKSCKDKDCNRIHFKGTHLINLLSHYISNFYNNARMKTMLQQHNESLVMIFINDRECNTKLLSSLLYGTVTFTKLINTKSMCFNIARKDRCM